MPLVLFILSLAGFGFFFQTQTWYATFASLVCAAGMILALWAMTKSTVKHVREEDVDLPPGPKTTRGLL